ncbi:long-chain fatty acid--CoA ligase [Rhodococcus erythropolis]|uniref:long-chain-fatty-acid--CoA ligase n=1 Tax=Rhodococcus erythropolis TaxID=1833 RepID=UPI001E5BC465|nr:MULTISPECIES: long-chain fatty acid--CoA ligase [Rhodococcus erythropolis group]MCD2107137.1 long-chain fatty acid--CoA ligase [Rhodococcus qingshengii]MCZ4526566.1 long-chain fatty acid--CoA ligase [Rhodococcus erythropolis]
MTNLATILTDSAFRHPEKIALEFGETEVPYSALDDASARVAGLLIERGLNPGDRVALMLPNVSHFAIIYYGILRAGGVVVPMNVLLKEREIAYHLADSGAHTLFVWPDFAAAAHAGTAETGAECLVTHPGEFERLLGSADPFRTVVGRDDGDTAIILYTSGTTGSPKGAELTHANVRGNVQVVADMLDLGPSDVVLGALPLFHAFGQTCGLNASVAAGARLVMLPRFDAAAALAAVDNAKVTVFEGVPTMFTAILNTAQDADTSSLRLCITGGSAMPVEVMRGFEERFDCTVLEGYGLSETSPVASFNHPGRERKSGSIGTPVAGVEFRLVDDNGTEVGADDIGEIAVRGPNVMKGYWNNPTATALVIDDGWFRTGDLARVDEDGYYYIVDRKKDMIIRGGYNVYPREIEEVLYTHPAVLEAAVVGIPDSLHGEEVTAVVSLRADHADVAPQTLIDFVRDRVAAYKYPRKIWLTDALPKGPTGKILKRHIVVPDENVVAVEKNVVAAAETIGR